MKLLYVDESGYLNQGTGFEGERTMTGNEAWSIVGPLLAAMMPKDQGPLETMADAYTTVYMALKQYGKEKNDEERDR